MSEVILTAQCITGHTWKMTPQQVEEAKEVGVAMCPECFNPATIEGAETANEKRT